MKENIKDYLANSRLAYLNQQNKSALKFADEARKLEPNNPEAHKCMADALLALGKDEKAIEHYQLAVKNTKKDDESLGDRYYDLGFAQASCNKLGAALRNLALADQHRCSSGKMVLLYTLMGVICFELHRMDDALINYNKAEELSGIDMDILYRKATIYGLKNDILNGIIVANQMKLIAPSDYQGYSVAFKLLVQANKLDLATTELKKAEYYTVPSPELYFDKLTLEMERYRLDNDESHLDEALRTIQEGLDNVEPTLTFVRESYINAAEINIQKKDGVAAVHCLNAALSPSKAFNNAFEVAPPRPLSVVEEIQMEAEENFLEEAREQGYEPPSVTKTMEEDEKEQQEATRGNAIIRGQSVPGQRELNRSSGIVGGQSVPGQRELNRSSGIVGGQNVPGQRELNRSSGIVGGQRVSVQQGDRGITTANHELASAPSLKQTLANKKDPEFKNPFTDLYEFQENPAEPEPRSLTGVDDERISDEHRDQINRLYIGAYTITKNFHEVVVFSRMLQNASTYQDRYLGMYSEANALKAMQDRDYERKYSEVIKFFRNCMIKDPTDLLAASFRIQCYMDLGKYDKAREICSVLAEDVQKVMEEKIRAAEEGGA